MKYFVLFICILKIYFEISPVQSFYLASRDNGTEFPLSIIHINDFHARFEESDEYGGDCNKNGGKCVGGYARTVSVVKHLKSQGQNPIYLNAGDNFQGTLYYNIGKWNITSYFLNLLPADAITLGNHEFDDAIAGVVPFLDTITSPVVVANIDDSLEPDFQNKYNKSIVIERSGRKIGIIGVIVQNTYEISSTGKLKFLDEVEAVKEEAKKLKDESVDIIVVLSHCGIERDYEIARDGGPYIDIIVGGHSHSLLYSGDNPPGVEKPVDKYPAEIIQESGRKVLIVQASAYARYVGNLTVYFDNEGELLRYEGAPIYLDNNIEEDSEIIRELEPWTEYVQAMGNKTVGETRVVLSRNSCNNRDCNVGNFITDAFVHEYAINYTGPYWTSAAVAFVNVGSIRTTINRGNLTFSQIITLSPFENTVDSFDLLGVHLLEALEHAVDPAREARFPGPNILQVSGLKITYNVRNPKGRRVIDVRVRCQKCDIPRYEPLKLDETYRIISNSFLIMGGDGFTMIKDNLKNREIGPKDYEVIASYAKFLSPIMIGEEGRITIHK